MMMKTDKLYVVTAFFGIFLLEYQFSEKNIQFVKKPRPTQKSVIFHGTIFPLL